MKIPQSCASCGLYKNAKSPKMAPYGSFKKKVLFIGSHPGEIEDRKGKPFQDRLSRKLQVTLKDMGFDLFRDGLVTYSCWCCPKDQEPTDTQYICCLKKVKKVVEEKKPKVIILLGESAVTSIIGTRWKKGTGDIQKWRGFKIPDRKYRAWVCPTFAIDYAKYDKDHKKQLVDLFFKTDIKNALDCIEKPMPVDDEEKRIIYIKTNKQFKAILPKLIDTDLLSFDYETTGLKPHSKQQKLISISACPDKYHTYAWMNNPYRAKQWAKVLQSKTPKTAHNLIFEETWSVVKINTKVNNWFWCTMQNAHILDNRQAISGLKFQTYINFGVPDYDSIVEPYLKGVTNQGANSINRIGEFIKEYGQEELLKYNALDSLFGWKLAKIQMGVLSEND